MSTCTSCSRARTWGSGCGALPLALLRHNGWLALVTFGDIRPIENLQELHFLLGSVLEIDAPARHGHPLCIRDFLAAQGQVELAGDMEDQVAHDLGLGRVGLVTPEI